jgi:hypothetical protein
VSYRRSTNRSLFGTLFLLGLILVLVLLTPFAGIWCINTLFDLNNPYDFTHWGAMMLSYFVLWSGSHGGSKS